MGIDTPLERRETAFTYYRIGYDTDARR